MTDFERDAVNGNVRNAFSLTHPLVLGSVIFALVLAIIVFGPTSDSRFIYTDF